MYKLSNKILLNKKSTKKYFNAFTLVELIVVIVILAILATIAFLSFNSYSSQSRDSVRLTDINSINKSLELFYVNASKYPDPTGIYTRVIFSGGVIFEQGNAGDSVMTAVQKVNKKPLDPLDSSEYTYSANVNRTSFQLKGTLENKLSTGYNNLIENSIPQLTSPNTGEELIGSIFPLTRGNKRGLFDGINLVGLDYNQVNADTGSGSRICYVKGNFNGLIEKTNTGNTNYILAVPGLIVNETNLNLDYNTLSGKVVCNGANTPCIITYTPMPVFVGENNAVPATSSNITEIMTNLQSAYSGSNSANNNPTITALLSATGTNLTNLGTNIVSKAGVTSVNSIVVNNISCSSTTYNGYSILAQNDAETRTYSKTGATTGGTRTYNIQASCNNGTISYSTETTSVACNSGYVQDAGYTCVASSCTSSITDGNAHSTASSQNGSAWHYSATAGACTWNCNTGYSRNGSKCEQDCPSGFIKVPGDTDFGQSTFCVAKYEMKQSVGSAGARSGGIAATNTLVGGTASSEYCTIGTPCGSTSSRNFTNGVTSKPDGNPITWINQYNAIQACNAMGAGYHLATENEWMTIARNIELNSLNWNTGIVGNGYLYSGHNDASPNHSLVASSDDNNGYINTGDSSSSPGDGIFGSDYASNIEQAYKGQKRTLTLSNGEVIWDFAGNVWEHVNKMNTLDGSDYNNGSSWVANACNYTGVIQYNSFYGNDGKAVCPYMNGYSYSNVGPKTPNLNAANGIGRIQGYSIANNIFLRGGNRYRGSNIGIYSITLDHNGARTVANEGFRCTKTIN